MRMGPANAAAHLTPLAGALSPEVLHVVRPGPQPPNLTASNIVYHEIRGRNPIARTVRVGLTALRVAMRPRVRLILSVNGYPYGVVAALVSFLTRTVFHSWLVGTDLDSLRSRPWWWTVLKRASFMTVPGEGFREQLVTSGYRGPISIVAHGVDPSRFNPGSNRDIDFLSVGYLVPIKKVDLTLRAMSVVRESHSEAQLRVIGDGPMREELVSMAATLGLSESVRFLGYQESPESWMRRSLIAIFPSEREGLPFALIEAMRCGVVPVVSRVGAVEDLVRDGFNGRILPADVAPEALASILLDALDNPDRLEQMSDNAVTSTSSLTYETVQMQWEQILALHYTARGATRR